MRDGGNFEGKVMDTYYEIQFKKKDPYIKFWEKTNDKDFDKQKIGLYVSWLEMIARRRKVRKAFLRYLNVTDTEDAGHFEILQGFGRYFFHCFVAFFQNLGELWKFFIWCWLTAQHNRHTPIKNMPDHYRSIDISG